MLRIRIHSDKDPGPFAAPGEWVRWQNRDHDTDLRVNFHGDSPFSDQAFTVPKRQTVRRQVRSRIEEREYRYDVEDLRTGKRRAGPELIVEGGRRKGIWAKADALTVLGGLALAGAALIMIGRRTQDSMGSPIRGT